MSEHFSVFLSITSGLPLVGGLGPVPSGLSLLLEGLQPSTLGLLLVDVLHQDTFVLENVTLGLEVQGVVPREERISVYGVAHRLTK